MSPDEETRLAEAALMAGRLADAEQICIGIVRNHPNHPAAWRCLGDAARKQGRLAEAIEFWQRGGRAGDDSRLEFDIGKALNELGRFDEATDHLQRAAAARKDWFEALTQLGIALGSAGRAAEAADAFREAVRLNSAAPQAHHNLGVALIQAGRPEDGIAALEHALRLQPMYPDAHYNLGNALATVGRREEAVDHFRQAAAQRPDYAEAYHNLGLHLSEANRPGEALSYIRQAVRLRPEAPDGHSNLGIALEALGRFDEAEIAYLEALRLDPRHADAHANLGNCYKAQGRLDEALSCYQLSLWLRSDSPSTRFNRSLALLQNGNWTEGWAEYEWRLRKPGGASRCPSGRPLWDGSDGGGRTILLWAEQGLGDAVQFCRYAPLVRERGFQVMLYVPGILDKLLRSLHGVDLLIAEGQQIPAHDVHCPLMSLPYRLGSTVDAVPAQVPYLTVDEVSVRKWREQIGDSPGRKVGLYWQGNPHHQWDRHRSLPLAAFAPLGCIPGIQLVSLQQGPGAEQLGRPGHPDTLQLGPDFQTLDDLAAVIQLMDLVVSVDTAAAHLSGALGRPTWLLVSTMSDWRWLSGRPDTPWYPTARLFRQHQLGDWRAVIGDVAVEIARWNMKRTYTG